MRTITVPIYKFHELSDSAKEKARDWYRCVGEDHGEADSEKSIEAFCAHFRVRIRYDVEACWFEHNADNTTFRERKLKDFNRDHMPTGYCLDCALWQTFYDVFKETGFARKAFDAAIAAALKEWQVDREYQDTAEYLDDFFEANNYEFTEDGTFYG